MYCFSVRNHELILKIPVLSLLVLHTESSC